MKKIINLITSIVLLMSLNSCSGYKPVFDLTGFKFKIEKYSLLGDERIGKKIYYQLYALSKTNSEDSKSIDIEINVTKSKSSTIKNSAGEILEYNISLTTDIVIKDFFTDKIVLIDTFDSSSSYKVQDQYSDTIKLENKIIEDLTNKIYQELLIKLSNSIKKS
jgi:hypothetical protein